MFGNQLPSSTLLAQRTQHCKSNHFSGMGGFCRREILFFHFVGSCWGLVSIGSLPPDSSSSGDSHIGSLPKADMDRSPNSQPHSIGSRSLASLEGSPEPAPNGSAIPAPARVEDLPYLEPNGIASAFSSSLDWLPDSPTPDTNLIVSPDRVSSALSGSSNPEEKRSRLPLGRGPFAYSQMRRANRHFRTNQTILNQIRFRKNWTNGQIWPFEQIQNIFNPVNIPEAFQDRVAKEYTQKDCQDMYAKYESELSDWQSWRAAVGDDQYENGHRRFAIFTCAGDFNKVLEWLRCDNNANIKRNWDLLVNYYGSDAEKANLHDFLGRSGTPKYSLKESGRLLQNVADKYRNPVATLRISGTTDEIIDAVEDSLYRITKFKIVANP